MDAKEETLSILQKILTKLQGLPQSDPYEFAGFSILLIFILMFLGLTLFACLHRTVQTSGLRPSGGTWRTIRDVQRCRETRAISVMNLCPAHLYNCSPERQFLTNFSLQKLLGGRPGHL
ncbi:small integral membrane protein 5 [Astyanax mexicanus]|uniref:Small integral membrane protein 5 n=1 Tax=Astyanax mexicanus TaxID=7994 RepID=A0A8T2KY25_ASTMX|nr:small integral membrane protein 5 [Astyanax mexicanus]